MTKPIDHHVRRTLVAAAAFASAVLAAPNTYAADDADGELVEIVVTGSRIGRSERDYVADSPIVTVSAENLTNASQPTVDSMLQRLPQLTGSGGIGNGQTATSAGSGLATLNLRNLGDNRNLVLIDGRRMTPASNTFAVDVNSLPVGIIDNVEIITGGASAVVRLGCDRGRDQLQAEASLSGIAARRSRRRRRRRRLRQRGCEPARRLQHRRGTRQRHGGLRLHAPERSAAAGPRVLPESASSPAQERGRSRSWILAITSRVPVEQPICQVEQLSGAAVGAPGAISQTAVLGFNPDGSLFTRDNTVYNFKAGQYPDNPLLTKGPAGIVYSGNYNNFADDAARALLRIWPLRIRSERQHHRLCAGAVRTIRFRSARCRRQWRSTGDSRSARYEPSSAGFFCDGSRTAAQPQRAPGSSSACSMAARARRSIPRREPPRRPSRTSSVSAGSSASSDWTWDLYGSHGESQIDNQVYQGTVINARYAQLMAAPNYGQNFVDPNNGTLRVHEWHFAASFPRPASRRIASTSSPAR